MKDLSLAQLDANLLIALNILLEERSVSRAARRMNVSQPAMSQTLLFMERFLCLARKGHPILNQEKIAAGDIVASSDIIFTLPAQLARHLANLRDLVTFEAPLDPPTFPVRLGWHARLDADPGNIWLRESIKQAMSPL